MNIRQKLITTLLVVSVIPMLTVATLFFSQAETSLKSARIAGLESIADIKVSMLEEIMGNLRKDAEIAQDYLNIKRNLPVLQRWADDRNNPAYIQAKKNLDSQLRPLARIKQFEDIMLTSPDGTVLYMTNESHMGIDFGQPLSDRVAFEKGKQEIYLGEIMRSTGKSAAYIMLVTAPVYGLDGALIGVIVFEVDMQPIYQLLQSTIGLGNTGETLIGRGMGDHALFLSPLRHAPDAAMQRKAMFGNAAALPIQEAVQGRSGAGISVDYRGEEIIAVWRHIHALNWGMVAKIDTSEAFSSVEKLRNISFIIGMLLLISMVFIAIVVARSFSQPILALRDGITRIGEGNLDVRVGTGNKDEIGQLSRTFDEMVENLQSVTASRSELEDEVANRKAAEADIENKNKALATRSRYDRSYSRAMALFSSTYDRSKALAGTLAILADNHPIPVSAIYEQDEWQGSLTCAASHGTPETLKQTFELGEGLVGQVASTGKMIILDADSDDKTIEIEAGIINFKPTAVVVCPIRYQEKVLGVLVLASNKSLTDLDTPFIERLADQLGVALNNIRQYSAMQELSEQLKQRSREITEKNLQLEQANRMKSEFLANMSHELRTPLNAIIGFSEVLRDGVVGEISGDQKEYIGDIFNSGEHLLSLINDILDLSKIEAGKMELDREDTDIVSLLNNSLSVIREKASTGSINLNLDIAEGVSTCLLDARKAKQIIYNLLSNAIKFTPGKGSISVAARMLIRAELPTGIASGLTTEENNILEISVTDSGIGITAGDQKKLFRAFTQVDSSLSRKYEGTGLGLVMVKRLAELHGGTVALESEPGKGSTFTVWLPCSCTATGTAAKKSTASSPEEPGKRVGENALVLVVEDDVNAADLLRLQLEDEGYRTITATTAEQALAILAETRPDLISLDILLPGMDGWNFLSTLKKDASLADIPVLIVSIVADKKKGFSLGAAQVLQKPVHKGDLLAAVAQVSVANGWNGHPIRVLVVDDDPKAVEFVTRHLESSHCTVLKAYGGAEAIGLAMREVPDLIILDLMMPDVSGFGVVEALKKSEDTTRIPVIILTAKVIDKEDLERLNGDVLKVIEKNNFGHDTFLSEVEHALSPQMQKQDTKAAPQQAPAATTSTATGKPKRTVPAKKPQRDKPLVLIVEDTANDANLLKHHLEGAGYGTLHAANGCEALDMMQHTMPDLITLDIMMPEMDGFEFLAEKGKQARFSDIPVLIISMVADTEKGMALGARAVLSKPFKQKALLNVVNSIGVAPEGGGRPAVLVVDDDPKSVKMISSYFNRDSYQVTTANDGRQALEEVSRQKPDLILLDLMMPEMSGFEVIALLKQDEKTRDIPIIVITAKLLTKQEREQLAEQVQAIEEKGGFDKKTFLDNVNSLLGGGA